MGELTLIDQIIKWGISPILAISIAGNMMQYRTNTKLIKDYHELTAKLLDLTKFIIERVKI